MRTLNPPSRLNCHSAISLLILSSLVAFTLGCSDDTDAIRSIQSQRQDRLQSNSKQDHLGEVFGLLSRLVELNPQQANRQISYHINRWREGRNFEATRATDLLRTISDVLPTEAAQERTAHANYVDSDISHLRDCYLFRQIVRWVDSEKSDDPLLVDWLRSMEDKLGPEDSDRLRTASRLFDWTVRNIAFEPKELTDRAPPAPSLSLGMKFRGAGYRQTDYQTVWRGTGDSLQRAGVFTQLCRQASIPAFVLAIQSVDSGELNPWCVGVLIGQEVYLFEPELSSHVPGPGQVGIATLAEARSDASVLRRLNVPGFFDYPLSKSDVQQCVALLNVIPEAVSSRMQNLESGLTGDRRMRVFVDADQLAQEIDAVPGIAGVRLWKTPLLAEVYQRELQKAAERDPILGFWHMSKWAILEAQVDMSQQLALARWRHLNGDFDEDEIADKQGARVLYLTQRAPEYEIEDLEIDVDLQKAYGVRRELGVNTETYNLQIQQAQNMMRLGKRTATYWITLIHYDDSRYETAENWYAKRVLDQEQLSHWAPAARYNRGRTLEQLGQPDRAIEIYKTDGDPQEHGNRIRSRLLAKSVEQ
ncbi:MAG: tol-pal system YbgF family protein [Rubripirellula sp.]